MDVWHKTNSSWEVQVSGDKMKETEKFCEKWNITMKVYIKDLKTAIDKQMKNDLVESAVKNPHHKYRFHKKFDYEKYNRFDAVSKHFQKPTCNVA